MGHYSFCCMCNFEYHHNCADYKEVEKMSVGQNIRTRRENAGLSQAYVAEQAGVSQAMLCQIERGTKNPSLQVAAEIAAVLCCQLDELLKDKSA